jgi:predicted RNA-binding Zn ribbon-like protein
MKLAINREYSVYRLAMAISDYAHIVDGVTLPLPLGGHPALDFCNTRAGWGEESPKEYLDEPRSLAVWAHSAGLISEEMKDEPVDLERSLRLRDALYAVLTGAGEGWELVARETESAAAAARLVRGLVGPTWQLDERTAGTGLPTLAVAWSAAALLVSPELALVTRCPGHGCGWLFLDRHHRRRWCTMATCGNRAKARRHLARRRLRYESASTRRSRSSSDVQ